MRTIAIVLEHCGLSDIAAERLELAMAVVGAAVANRRGAAGLPVAGSEPQCGGAS